jgi:hypothetical protein
MNLQSGGKYFFPSSTTSSVFGYGDVFGRNIYIYIYILLPFLIIIFRIMILVHF